MEEIREKNSSFHSSLIGLSDSPAGSPILSWHRSFSMEVAGLDPHSGREPSEFLSWRPDAESRVR